MSGDRRDVIKRRARLLRKTFFAPLPSDVQMTIVSTRQEFEEALTRIQEEFVRLKYIEPKANVRVRFSELLPEELTFLAKRNEELLGVMSIVKDTAEFGLPSDTVYSKEINALRIPGPVYEATNELVLLSPEDLKKGLKFNSKNRGVAGGLMQCLIALTAGEDRLHNEQSSIIAAIDPQKIGAYEFMGFRQSGDRKHYNSSTKDETILVSLDVSRAEEQVKQQDDLMKKSGQAYYLHNYFFAENPQFKLMPSLLSRQREFFKDIKNLDWFIKAGELEELITPEQHEILERKWANPYQWGSPRPSSQDSRDAAAG